MSEETRRVARAFLDDVERTGGMHDAARNHAADDVVWSLPVSTRKEPLRGIEEVAAWYGEREVPGVLFDTPPKVSAQRLLVDGDMAVAEVRTQGPTAKGKVYDNVYAFMMRIENGRIAEFRNFYDTLHVVEVLKT